MNLEPKDVHNFDETAVTYAIGPTYVFIPKEQARAAQDPGYNVKARITAVVSYSGNGQPDPLMFIIRHSGRINASKCDQTSAQVVQNLHKDNDGFGQNDG